MIAAFLLCLFFVIDKRMLLQIESFEVRLKSSCLTVLLSCYLLYVPTIGEDSIQFPPTHIYIRIHTYEKRYIYIYAYIYIQLHRYIYISERERERIIHIDYLSLLQRERIVHILSLLASREIIENVTSTSTVRERERENYSY